MRRVRGEAKYERGASAGIAIALRVKRGCVGREERVPEVELLRVHLARTGDLETLQRAQAGDAQLGEVKSNVDSGVFDAIQIAGIAALCSSQACVEDSNKIYQERRDALIEGLTAMGLEVKPPKATFYGLVCELSSKRSPGRCNIHKNDSRSERLLAVS